MNRRDRRPPHLQPTLSLLVAEIRRRAHERRELLLFALVGLLYLLGPRLSPLRHLSRQLDAELLLSALLAATAAALLALAIDDRRLRRRLRAEIATRHEVEQRLRLQ